MKNALKIAFIFNLLYNNILLAQKNPSIQSSGIWLPNVKVDGKLDEWSTPLNTFNKKLHCYYSLANDSKNLYLAIKSDRTEKIFSGGITVKIDRVEITFPYNKKRDRRPISNRGPIKSGDPRVIKDFKEIHLKSIPGIKDSLISIYNQYGIKVMINEYEDKAGVKFYDYELCVPLKYLAIPVTTKSINYTIKFNGIVSKPTGAKIVPIPGKTQREMMEIEENLADVFSITQLFGNYMMAAKP